MIAHSDRHVNNYFSILQKTFEGLDQCAIRLVRVIDNIAFPKPLVNSFFPVFDKKLLAVYMWYLGFGKALNIHLFPSVPMKGSGSFLPCRALLMPLIIQ